MNIQRDPISELNAYIRERGKLRTALKEARAGLQTAVAVIEKRAPQADWPGSSPRKALVIVEEALHRKRP